MTEWITSWKEIAKYLGVSVRAAQRYSKNGLRVYPAGSVRADAKELDKFVKNKVDANCR
jgi:predicted site-specific integrase-resolvase